jgi:hypothetical protein
VLKMNGIALPTPTGQVSAQSDYFCYVKVHLESVRAKTAILIAKVILLKNHKTIVIWSLISGCKVESGKKRPS